MHVGFLFNCSMNTNPRARLSPTVVNRAMLIDAELRRFGSRVFYYSPKHITSIADEVPGYLIEGSDFVPTTAPIPLVNGNWTYNTRRLMDQGIGLQSLIQWSDDNQVGIYVPLAFSELVANKHEAYKLVRGFRDDLHPHTELYRHSLSQLEYFMERGDLLFIKPRAGNKGDRIVTVRRIADGFSLRHYEKGTRRSTNVRSLRAAVGPLREFTGGSGRYIIQQGVETLRYEESVFDLRVVMIYDGSKWNWLHEVRFSPRGSDLSNVSQGGVCFATEEVLYALLGDESGSRVLDELRSESFGLATYLEKLHPGELMEIAFDFVLDKHESLRLIEINTKPGLANVGFTDSVVNMKPELEPLFRQWVYPHTESLARFLQSKIAAL